MTKNLAKQNPLAKKPFGAKPSLSSFDDAVHGRGLTETTCLLLDISYSMQDDEMAKLRSLADEFPDTTRVCFHSDAFVLTPSERIPNPGGSTNLTEGIQVADKHGFTSAVLVTDGHPDDPGGALKAAKDTQIKLDIVYVGSGAEPQFLKDLAQACGGTYQRGNLSEQAKIADTVAGLLGAPTTPPKGPIIL